MVKVDANEGSAVRKDQQYQDRSCVARRFAGTEIHNESDKPLFTPRLFNEFCPYATHRLAVTAFPEAGTLKRLQIIAPILRRIAQLPQGDNQGGGTQP